MEKYYKKLRSLVQILRYLCPFESSQMEFSMELFREMSTLILKFHRNGISFSSRVLHVDMYRKERYYGKVLQKAEVFGANFEVIRSF